MNLTEDRRREIEAELAQAGVSLGDRYRFDCFGNTAELAADLGALVAGGEKTATAAYYGVYDHYGIDPPKAGETEIVCDFGGVLLAVIQIVDVRVVPFEEVGAEHARLEGEGDRSLEHWRRVHRDYFTAECEAMGVTFSETAPILCQRFRLLYAPGV